MFPPMTYRMVFRLTVDGYLRVNGYCKNACPLEAVHASDQLFAAVVGYADIPIEKATVIAAAAKEAWPAGERFSAKR
jgi:hypothetical protein